MPTLSPRCGSKLATVAPVAMDPMITGLEAGRGSHFSADKNMADDKPVKIGVVGLGYWGKNYLRLTNENSLTELVGMCDLYPPTLERAKKWYPEIPPFSSVEELLAVDGLEAVVVVVPASTYTFIYG